MPGQLIVPNAPLWPRWSKVRYLGRMARDRILQRNRACPNCGGIESSVVSRKYLVTELLRCSRCLLMFRYPTDSTAVNGIFYNESYSHGFTTDMPSEIELQAMLHNRFIATPKDYTYYIAVLQALGLGAGSRLFDYGCSWGYGTWQLQKVSFDCEAAEISRPRAAFAREKLGLRVADDLDSLWAREDLAGTFDGFFSAHVLEHVPAPDQVIALADRLLRDGGLFVAFVPNGAEQARQIHATWDLWWGEVHPNFIDDVFLERAFENVPKLFASSPVDLDALARVSLQEPGTTRLPLFGAELLFVARMDGLVLGDVVVERG